MKPEDTKLSGTRPPALSGGGLTVNGRPTEVPPGREEVSLLTFLREDLGLTGTKNGCGIGVCGSCTVLMDGEARKSCKTPVSAVLGRSVLTIEGVAGADGGLHPLQQAFMDAGAVQCGFCTPGMILRGIHLLSRNPRPNREEIRRAYAGNLCRCTGYQQIVDAVELAASRMAADSGDLETGI